MKLNLTGAAFRSNNSLRPQTPFNKQNPLNEALNKVIQNVEVKAVKESELNKKIQKEAVSRATFDTYVSSDKSMEGALDEIDTDTLKIIEALVGNAYKLAAGYQDEINSFHQNLSAFDTKITQYQDMLDGKAEITEGYSKDMIKELLDKSRAERETYRKEGAEKIQEKGTFYKAMIEANSKYGAAILGDEFVNISNMDLDFRADAEDIYGEMDRVTSSLNQIKEGAGSVLKLIQDELKKRGEAIDPMEVKYEKVDFDNPNLEILTKTTQEGTWQRRNEK